MFTRRSFLANSFSGLALAAMLHRDGYASPGAGWAPPDGKPQPVRRKARDRAGIRSQATLHESQEVELVEFPPVPDGSLTDFVVQLGAEVTADEVNARFRELADTGPLAGILLYSDEPLVSSDVVGNSYSCIFDSDLTMAHGRSVKVFGWYDNEWGYSCRLVDLVQRL